MIKPTTIYAAAVLALSAAAFMPATSMAQVGVSVVIGNEPPPPRFESVPAARRGYVWAPGYWNWEGRRHVWLNGHWEPEHRGQQWRRAEWVREGGGWRLSPGGWVEVGAAPVAVEYISAAPPAPRFERIPEPRPGYVWGPGYWEWRGNRHEWVGGGWIAERPGYIYSAPHWTQRDGHWFREEAHWDHHEGYEHGGHHDRDHDGVPDRYDHHPDNPHRD